jgi:hypothetical protein
MIGWLTHLQHTRGKNVWFVRILDERLDDFNRKVFQRNTSPAGLERADGHDRLRANVTVPVDPFLRRLDVRQQLRTCRPPTGQLDSAVERRGRTIEPRQVGGASRAV